MICPACKMVAPDGAAYCDFCKEPFAKKKAAAPAAAPVAPAAPAAPAAEPPPDLPVDVLLKQDAVPPPAAPAWLRPVAYGCLALMLAAGLAALYFLQQRYQERQMAAPPPGSSGLPLPR